MPDPFLNVIDPRGRRKIAIDKPLFTIGRRTAADLRVESSDVSREHAEIARDGNQCVLRDRGSTYGTFVNGERVVDRVLVHGDRIRLGHTSAVELVFQDDALATLSSLREVASDPTDLRQMAALMGVLRAFGSGRILSEVLALVVDSALDVTKAERGFVMLANDQGGLEFSVARGRGGVPLTGESFSTSTRIPRQVFGTGQSCVVEDLAIPTDTDLDRQTRQFGIRGVMCVPLRVAPIMAGPTQHTVYRNIGVLYLDSRDRSAILSPATLFSLEAFATQAALAIESARLYAESSEKARIDRDLRVAAEIQRSLLAEPLLVRPSCDLAAASIPCRTVGGDFYDYLELAGDDFAFALGDVAGKGPPAALLAAVVQSHFVAQATATVDPAKTMAGINTAMLRRPIEARFATMFCGVLANDGLLSYCNAGQEPPVVIHLDGSTTLDAGGPVLGLLPGAPYDTGTFQLRADDLVIVCSDGVTEAVDLTDQEFGRDRMIDVVARCRGQAPEAVLDALLGAVRTFSQGTPQADDITALVLRYRQPVLSR
jgi:serine phosphatase RsbU (regulator of sigma subunit)/pSer/pThr/pTyr-binding forkhead associated (FHA) protein